MATRPPKSDVPVTLCTPEKVADPVTARADVVAPVRETYPPPTALRTPAMVEEPVERRLAAVARPLLVMEKRVVVESPTVEEATAKRVCAVEDAPWKMVRLA